MSCFLLISLLFGCFETPVQAQQDPRTLDPADIFFQAWLEIQKAEKLEKNSQFSESWQKYRQAAKYYDALDRFHKNWKPNLVKNRIKSTHTSIKNIEPKVAAELAGKNVKTQDLVEGGANPKIHPSSRLLGTGQVKQPQIKPATPRPVPLKPTIAATDPTLQRRLQKLERDNRTLQQLERNNRGILLQLERDNKSLRDALKRAQATTKFTQENRAEQQRLIDLIAKKNHEIHTMQDILARAPLQQDMDRLTREKNTREQELAITARAVKESQRKLVEAKGMAEKHRSEADLAQRRAEKIEKDMQDERGINNRVIRELRKELQTVTSLLKRTRQDLGAANDRVAQMQRQLDQSQSTIKELTQERDTLRIERDALANILKKSDSKGVQNLITENMRLGRELKTSMDRLKFVETSHNATKDDLLNAKSDLAIAKTRIMRYQQDQADHGRMIQSLESQLLDAKLALEVARANPAQDENMEEIEILKGTVKRLIAAQERRRMGEKILWETYRKSKRTIAGMATAIKDIRSTKVELTDEEKRLVSVRSPDSEFRNPDRVSPAHARAHGDALQKEIYIYTPLMKRAFEKGRYEAARQILLDMDERFPGHFPTLCNRGVVELKTKNYRAAIDIFNEAITMRENSSYAHYMLGLSQYKNNDIDSARNAFQRTLDIKPGNARAHLYLGNLAGAGRRYQQAEEHFLTAIQLEPTDANAYYNLSVLYLQQKRKKDAMELYRKALDHGKNPSPSHEQKLNS
ncbi:MAG: tetratricopeptide repeat protein [Verrucomicrobiae bacterium]|nr:tetratricopeptide repeat protein [Verrucomicrobiae bacterium]NNJ43187.1 tetratricopeptide repeat protein [Akkermansiaceae bacterium]